MRARLRSRVAAAVAICVAAGVVALLAAHATARAPATTGVVSTGGATVILPGEWQTLPTRRGGPTPVMQLANPPLRVLVTLAPVDDRTLVPKALRELTRGVVGRPRPTRLAGYPAWLYSGLRARGSRAKLDVTVLPSSRGVLGVGCLWAPGAPRARACAASVSSVTLDSGEFFAPSDRLALALRLPTVLGRLDHARVGARARLRAARTPADQARLAGALAHAHFGAADSLRPVAGRIGAALVSSLTDAGGAYLALGRAATGGSASRFASARRTLQADEDRLTAAVDDLSPQLAHPAVAATPAQAPPPGSRSFPLPLLLLLLLGVPVIGGVLVGGASRRARGTVASAAAMPGVIGAGPERRADVSPEPVLARELRGAPAAASAVLREPAGARPRRRPPPPPPQPPKVRRAAENALPQRWDAPGPPPAD
jgi:hypothetical protein